MAKVFEFLADGFEDIEALGPVDIFRRGGVEIQTVSVNGSDCVTSAHGITVKADVKFEDADFSGADLLMLPGGLPGATNLGDHEGLCKLLTEHAAKGGMISAICAAPMVLGKLGLLKGKRATCYPGFEKYMEGAEYTGLLFSHDGNIVTGEGPAATFPYAYHLLSNFIDEGKVKEIERGMMFTHLIKGR